MVFPTIPDSLPKVFLLAGAALIIYYFYNNQVVSEKHSRLRETLIRASDSATNLSTRINFELELVDQKYKLFIDSMKFVGSKMKSMNDAEIAQTEKMLNERKQEIIDFRERIAQEQLAYQLKINDQNSIIRTIKDEGANDFDGSNEIPVYLGIFFLFLGYLGFINLQVNQNELLTRQIAQLPKHYDNCQSCGVKFNSVVKYGTEEDRTINKAFCYECYQDGEFERPNLTFSVLINEKKIKGFFAMRKIKNLDRWINSKWE